MSKTGSRNNWSTMRGLWGWYLHFGDWNPDLSSHCEGVSQDWCLSDHQPNGHYFVCLAALSKKYSKKKKGFRRFISPKIQLIGYRGVEIIPYISDWNKPLWDIIGTAHLIFSYSQKICEGTKQVHFLVYETEECWNNDQKWHIHHKNINCGNRV